MRTNKSLIEIIRVIFLITLCDLKNFQNTDNFKKTEIVDINETVIDSSQPINERTENFLAHIGNPYFFNCGEVPVMLTFSNNGESLSGKLREHFMRQRH